MAAFDTEHVLSVHHWNDSLFSFTTTRGRSLRFENGHFVMIGLEVDGKPLLRAYSIASAALRRAPRVLQHQGAGRRADLAPAAPEARRRGAGRPQADRHAGAHRPAARRNLYLLGTGTGLAPFLSIIRDPETYERFEKIVLVHGVRQVDELAYADLIATSCRTTSSSASW